MNSWNFFHLNIHIDCSLFACLSSPNRFGLSFKIHQNLNIGISGQINNVGISILFRCAPHSGDSGCSAHDLGDQRDPVLIFMSIWPHRIVPDIMFIIPIFRIAGCDQNQSSGWLKTVSGTFTSASSGITHWGVHCHSLWTFHRNRQFQNQPPGASTTSVNEQIEPHSPTVWVRVPDWAQFGRTAWFNFGHEIGLRLVSIVGKSFFWLVLCLHRPRGLGTCDELRSFCGRPLHSFRRTWPPIDSIHDEALETVLMNGAEEKLKFGTNATHKRWTRENNATLNRNGLSQNYLHPHHLHLHRHHLHLHLHPHPHTNTWPTRTTPTTCTRTTSICPAPAQHQHRHPHPFHLHPHHLHFQMHHQHLHLHRRKESKRLCVEGIAQKIHEDHLVQEKEVTHFRITIWFTNTFPFFKQ